MCWPQGLAQAAIVTRNNPQSNIEQGNHLGILGQPVSGRGSWVNSHGVITPALCSFRSSVLAIVILAKNLGIQAPVMTGPIMQPNNM